MGLGMGLGVVGVWCRACRGDPVGVEQPMPIVSVASSSRSCSSDTSDDASNPNTLAPSCCPVACQRLHHLELRHLAVLSGLAC
ncbi:hypothetical protein Micbo1qcDRAFT_154856 [Microdochium bolleyi]|uniref:Uncharacterized protein n=1 Tax=Microdochium bolleyi TaxID=196109 RepID=A0A136JGU4_9PEZI|nr:hypothetical protein Micbo1qcDRAFT_154856 [Microdochium bolleyi]